MLGALLMSAGHLAMSFDQSFLIALLLLIVGSGCLKGNISAQVGQLYPPDEETRRTGGFTIFSAAINIGAVARPAWLRRGRRDLRLARRIWARCSADDPRVGHLSLGATAPAGQRLRRMRDGEELPPLTRDERKRVAFLVIAIALTVLPNVAYPMIWNIGILFINDHVSLATPLGAVPASWFNSIDAFASIVVVPPLVALWAWQARRGREPSDVAKIGIGCAITGVSALFLRSVAPCPGRTGRSA